DDCLGMFSSCDPNNDKCCPNRVCRVRDQWCKYKLW
uniref:Kappa-theraphotoxin-Tb1c n=1 Tax=Theraphosa blondi TaxID=260533 RepID=TX3_THEBL|nr:RecName: Full=Kappa-theraphotoxin-Tb1c; Short=Kappa-TRTX-Tb1c; AltName: Full=Theraphotoxin-3; AltName: Full=TlTx3 [Theraphosa blondi]